MIITCRVYSWFLCFICETFMLMVYWSNLSRALKCGYWSLLRSTVLVLKEQTKKLWGHNLLWHKQTHNAKYNDRLKQIFFCLSMNLLFLEWVIFHCEYLFSKTPFWTLNGPYPFMLNYYIHYAKVWLMTYYNPTKVLLKRLSSADGGVV